MVRTLGVGGSEFLEHLGDAHHRRLPHTGAVGGAPGSRELPPLPPLPAHRFVLVPVAAAAWLARWLGGFLRCSARGLVWPAVSRPGGGRFLWRCTEGKPRASRDGERGAQRVWADGHARQVGHDCRWERGSGRVAGEPCGNGPRPTSTCERVFKASKFYKAQAQASMDDGLEGDLRLEGEWIFARDSSEKFSGDG
jgi:hypothetical protein